MRRLAPKRTRIGVRPHLEFSKWGLTPIRVGAFAVAALGALTAAAQTVPASRQLPGVAYDMRMSTTAAAMGNMTQGFTGHAVSAGGRGRIDIVDGGMMLFGKGDYMLFDSTGVTVVRPATHEYVALSSELADNEQLGALFKSITLSDVKALLDSLPGSDTVAGYPTRHFRMTLAVNMSIDASMAQQRMATESITDYWIANVPGLPNNPLVRANTVVPMGAASGPFKALNAKVDSLAARMGTATALRTKTVSRLILGPGQATTTEQSSEVTNIRHVNVDEASLAIPAGYRKTSIRG